MSWRHWYERIFAVLTCQSSSDNIVDGIEKWETSPIWKSRSGAEKGLYTEMGCAAKVGKARSCNPTF